MCTIVKVKRKITDDPVDCLVIECKKKKLQLPTVFSSNGSKERREIAKASIKQVLKYVGSASNEEEIPAKINELKTKSNIRINDNETPVEGLKSAKMRRHESDEKPINEPNKKLINYVVLSKKRGLDNEKEPRNVEDVDNRTRNQSNVHKLDDVNIIDVISSEYFEENEANEKSQKTANNKMVDKIACNGVEMIREKVDKDFYDYVYDIYYSMNHSNDFDLLNRVNFEVKSYELYDESELIDENLSSDEKEDIYDDEDDSNDEQNWRNDYPDDEDSDDIDDEDDDEPRRRSNYHRSNPYYDELDDYYDEYSHGYEEDDRKLSSYMKKSLALDRSHNENDDDDDDFDEYLNEPVEHSYDSYKKRILKEFKKDYQH